ncbi:MAG: hypothetical protein ENTB_01135 [Enterocloster aldenensis]
MGDYGQMIKGARSEWGTHFLMDSMPAGFFRCSADRERRVDFVNRGILELFRCADEDEFNALTGSRLGGMILDKDYHHAISECRKQLREGRELLKTEFRIVRKDKSTCWVDCRGRIIKGDEGQVWLYAMMLDDTEDKDRICTYREKSRRDPLTGLLNREASRERISEFLEADGKDGMTAALMIVDLDNFKEVNDTKGHLFGDSVLTEAAGCMNRVSRKSDVVARIGGDEFLVFLAGMGSREEVRAYADRIMEGMSGISAAGDNPLELRCCIGVSMYPEHGNGFDQLFTKADIALYSGKKTGKGKCVFYEPSLPSVDVKKWEAFSGRVPAIDSDNGPIYGSDKVIHYVFKALYESEDTRKAINTILKIVGLQFNVSRVYIFEDSLDGLFMSNTFEWCNQGISPQIDNLQHMSYEEDAPGYRDNFDKDGIFLCMDVDELHPVQREVLASQGIKAILQCGIYDDGRLVGFIGFDECRENRRWTREQISVLTYVAQIVGTFLLKDRVQNILMQKLDHLQSVLNDVTESRSGKEAASEDYDGLTNLLTVGAFERQMEEYLKTGPKPERTAALLLDMDDFHKINEACGKLFGNVVLMNIASCLKRTCREGDLIGRFGGDEFLVLLKDTDMKDALRTASLMVREISSMLDSSGYGGMTVGCSIGGRMIAEDEKGFYDIMVKADQAMHQVKKEGKGGVRFYESVTDKEDDIFTYERLKELNDKKLKEQSSLQGKTSTAVALEVFEKTSSFEEALHILMGFIASRFRLNRIAVYMNWEREGAGHSAFQWVDDRTAMLFDPSDTFRQEEFYLSYNLYDSDGIAVLNRDKLEVYNTGMRRIMDRARAGTMLFAGIFMDGRYVGMMVLVNTEEVREWTRSERSSISELAKVVGTNARTSLRLLEARQKAEYYKNRDILTGLMSYACFKDECQRMMDEGADGYVIIASDIKGFKFINEAVGYTQGDNILRMFADMLTQNGREENRYTRVSADQFLCFGICRMDRVKFVGMVQRLNEDFCRIQNQMFTNVNIMVRSGIYFIEQDCREIDAAIDRANIARRSVDYIIQSASVVFNDGPFDSGFREHEIINRMEYALKHQEFKVYLQPKLWLKDQSLAGAEALVRWQREDGTVIAPGEFLPLFEKNGFISQMDLSIFRQVCRKLREWLDKGVRPVCISLNLSSVDIQMDHILSDIMEGTREYGIDHRFLEFELTETAFLKDTERTFHVMKELRDSGFTTSIDDFGSGYSIMNMMADIPSDVIKLDCGFVQSCRNTERGREFLRQLIQMTNKMGFVSLCEGIETKEQLDMVTEMGCSIGQGYYFSKPIPMDDFFEKYLKSFY